jgi:hypothetical protein
LAFARRNPQKRAVRKFIIFEYPRVRISYLINSNFAAARHVKMTDPRAKTSDPAALAAAIAAACKGLVYVSETDAPVEPFSIENADGKPVPALLESEFGDGRAGDIDSFFARLTVEQPWHTPLQQRAVKKYRTLRNLLLKNLENVSTYRFGRIRVEILVAGRDAAGNVQGIKTRAVET